jgi:cyanophycinase-like exopeptidase
MLHALALTLAALRAPRQPEREWSRPGLVVLLGVRARDEDVPELCVALEPRVTLLVGAVAQERAANVVVLDPLERYRGDDPALCASVRAARRIDLDGASLLDWLSVLYPQRRECELARALREAHAGGALLVGRGVCAALLSAATVIDDPAEIGAVEHNPRDLGRARVAWTLGFQPWAVVDDVERGHGSFERLVDVMEDQRLRLGLFLGERAALIVDRAVDGFRGAGSGWSAVLDPRAARCAPGSMQGARLTLLGPGQVYSRRERGATSVDPARGEQHAPRVEHAVANAFDVEALAGALADSARTPAGELVLRDTERTLVIKIDARSGVAAPSDAAARWSQLHVDLTWTVRR